MKFVKRLLLTLLIFTIIVVIISLFLPSSFHLERKIVVSADKEMVFKQVNDLKNWRNWAPWSLMDSTIYLNDNNFSTPSFGEKATFKWESNVDEVGEGNMEISKSIENEMIEYIVDFGMGDVLSGFYLSDNDDGVEIKWTMDIDFGFSPFSKFFGLFIEDYVASDYELGLKRLKSFSENLPKIKSVKVEKIAIDKQWFLSIRDTINPMEMNNIHGKIYAEINKFMNENGIEISDSPIVIYHFWSDSIIDIEAGIPIHDSIVVQSERIRLNEVAKGNVVKAIHYGAYDRLQETYFGINEWMRKNDVTVIGPPWEQYITDPSTQSNPEKWQTAIFFPVK